MNVTTNRAALAAALRISASTSSNDATQAQLACVKLNATTGKLTLSATNLTVSSIVEVTCAGTGAAVVSAKSLSAVVGTLDADDVSLSLEGGTLTVRGGKRKNQLPTIGRPEDFPRIADASGAKWESVSGSALGELIAATVGVCSPDPSRGALCGVNLRAAAGVMTAIAGDGPRLHHIQRSTGATFAPGTIPVDGCKVVASLCEDEEVDLARDATTIYARHRNVTIMVRLLDGDFPDFSRVVPTKNERIATIDRKAMIDALARSKMVTGKEHKDTGALPVVIAIDGTEAHLSSRNKDGFVAEDALDVEHRGAAIKTACNPEFIVAALKAIDCERVTLRCGDELAPVLVHRAGETTTATSGDYAVIMPQRR